MAKSKKYALGEGGGVIKWVPFEDISPLKCTINNLSTKYPFTTWSET